MFLSPAPLSLCYSLSLFIRLFDLPRFPCLHLYACLSPHLWKRVLFSMAPENTLELTDQHDLFL